MSEANRTYLKVKIVSLGDESKYIKFQEQKFRRLGRDQLRDERCRQKAEHAAKHYAMFWGLRNHRARNLRPESRAACIAYAYTRGKSYEDVEHYIGADVFYKTCFIKDNIPKNSAMAPRHGLVIDDIFMRAARLVQKYPSENDRVDFDEIYKRMINWRNEHPVWHQACTGQAAHNMPYFRGGLTV